MAQVCRSLKLQSLRALFFLSLRASCGRVQVSSMTQPVSFRVADFHHEKWWGPDTGAAVVTGGAHLFSACLVYTGTG